MLSGKVFPFTWRGFFLFAASLGCLITGFFRADLAALFWGASFLVLSVCAFVANLLGRIILVRKIKESHIQVHYPNEGHFPGEDLHYSLIVELPSFIFPAFKIMVTMELISQNNKLFTLRHSLGAGRNVINGSIAAPGRGFYSNNRMILSLQDIGGFTNSTITRESSQYVTIYPSLYPLTPGGFSAEGSDTEDQFKSRKRSDELFEVRKYFPGDDPRKINWKMMAHLGELYLRQGDETPPPETRLIFILDLSFSPYIPQLMEIEYLDRLLEGAASFMAAHIHRGEELLLSIPGFKSFRIYNQQKLKELLADLGKCSWQEPALPPLPAKKSLRGIIFSAPGSIGLPGILKEFRIREWQVSLFFKDFYFKDPKKQSAVKKFFFLPEGNGAPDFFCHKKEFKSALLGELNKYGKRPWSIDDAGIL